MNLLKIFKSKEDRLYELFLWHAKKLRKISCHLPSRHIAEAFNRPFIKNYFLSKADFIYGDVLEWEIPMYAEQFAKKPINLKTAAWTEHRHIYPNATFYFDLDDASTLPAEKFDCIVAPQVFICTINLDEWLKNTKSMLKPGGRLIMTTHGSIFSGEPASRHQLGYTVDALSRILTKTFGRENIINIEGFGNYEYALYQLLSMRTPPPPPRTSPSTWIYEPAYTLIIGAVVKSDGHDFSSANFKK